MANLDFATLIVSVLLWISWLIAMAGAAAAQADGVSGTGELAFTWWVIWFTFFLLIFICLSACMANANMNKLRNTLLLMATVIWMQVANQANLSSKGGANLGGLAGLTGAAAALSDVSTDFKVVLAGAILTLIFSFLLIIYWGLTDHGAQGLSLRKSTEPAPAEPTKQVEAVTVEPVV